VGRSSFVQGLAGECARQEFDAAVAVDRRIGAPHRICVALVIVALAVEAPLMSERRCRSA